MIELKNVSYSVNDDNNNVENANMTLLNAVIRTLKPRNIECNTQEDYYVVLCKILHFKTLPCIVLADIEREYNEIFVQKFDMLKRKYQAEINKINAKLTQTRQSIDTIKNAKPSYSFMRDISTEEQKLYKLSSKCNSLRTRKEMLIFVKDYVSSKLSEFCNLQDVQCIENTKRKKALKHRDFLTHLTLFRPNFRTKTTFFRPNFCT
mgnify:CR=1 FL=1